MAENKHTLSDLYQMQSLSLDSKISMTRRRIQGWVDEFGEDGVYVSFSGGKDSTVLLHLVRQDYPNVKAVFIDTGLEYPEIRQFVRTFSNVDILFPKMNFRQVIEKYGYPFISKEVSETVDYARRYVKALEAATRKQTTICPTNGGLARNRKEVKQREPGISEFKEWDYAKRKRALSNTLRNIQTQRKGRDNGRNLKNV